MLLISFILLEVIASFDTKDAISRTQNPYILYKKRKLHESFVTEAVEQVCSDVDFPHELLILCP